MNSIRVKRRSAVGANRRSPWYVVCAIVWLLAGSNAVAEAMAGDAFVPVQSQLFAVAGAFSNAWADYDGDGDADLAVSFRSGEVRLYKNDARGFVEVSAAAGLSMRGAEARALAWGDYDADGDFDLYVGALDQVYLMRNDAGTFKDVASEVGIVPGKINSRQATWIDYDNDGDLDLHLANRSSAGPDFLFRNERRRFIESATQAGLADARRAVGACWFDMDRDGDLDVFLAHQDGDTDALYRNERGKFVDVAAALHMDRADRKGRAGEGSVGCTVGDYDNDGDLDLFVAAYGTSVLYRNDGGRYTEVAASTGLIAQGHAVGASWGDYDNDGNLDLYITNYHGEPAVSQPAAYLFRSSGSRFKNIMRSDSLINAADHGVQWADYDRDGDLDLSVTRGYTAQGGAPIFRNELGRDAGGRSMQVVVLDSRGRQTCAGAEVRLFDGSGKVLGTRLVMGGEGYNSQSALPVHFGLPRAQQVTVEVTYFTASGRVTQRVEKVAPAELQGRALTVRMSSK